ncbi:hypothetical protein QJS04_geneDACA013026 [Acorus gramineus]|uniref:Uncharacterized protein n=1 Tax=Acorus gramineus TaxID=55184 RepID=A0AAV9B5F8_ACOGR|nr:hypothetical protein QJS04_geneDACA013026 [Acorus gramineus]
MGTPVNIVVGSHVWVEDPEAAWIDGEVVEINGGNAKIVTTNGKTITSDLSSMYPKDTEVPPAGVDDMTKLAYLHEPGDVKRFKVKDPKKFRYLNQTNCYEVANVDDAREYLETRHAMDVVGISLEEQDAIFRVVAAILHLGNIDFVKGKEVDSSKLKDETAIYHLKMAAELLMCDEKDLEDSLCKRVIVTPDGNITKFLDPESAALSRDALAKTVYSRLFDWIVDKINNSIGQDPDAKSIIGVLDIYGFESFKINSFEQLCINLTNEKLQQHFNQHVFKMEQEEYTHEEINWSYVEFVDNQDVLDLIEKKPGGIIALLDEACMFPKSTHETFAQKMYQTYKAHKRFSKPKLARTAFTINHYAGDVVYQADHFLDKNKDYVVAEHQALLNASKCPFVANLFPPLPEESSKQSKFSSIGTRFKQQLQSLMETLSTTEPHYIRCVKPNGVLLPGIFENFNVLNQLRCGGVLEAIRISCAGYPTKRTFDEFLDRFQMLAPDVLDGSDEKSACATICDRMGLKGYQAARETGALKEAKDKLEKRVEELTWRLDFEKHMRIDIEEAKGQEIAKLQSTLQETQSRLEEANAAIIRVKEEARIAIEEAPPVIKEVPIVDNIKLELLTNKNKELEDQLNDFKMNAEEFERKYCEVQKQNETWLKEIKESQSKISELQEMMERLESSLSNLESENQVLRQQALDAKENEDLSEEVKSLQSKIAMLETENQLLHNQTKVNAQPVTAPDIPLLQVTKNLENGYQVTDEPKTSQLQEFVSAPPPPAMVQAPPPLPLAKQKSLNDRQQNHGNVSELAYWLSTTSTLLFLLQNTLKAGNTSRISSHRGQTMNTTLFGRLSQSQRSSSSNIGISSGYSGMVGKLDVHSKVEAKYPALLFKQHLTAYVEKIYGMIRDILKKEIAPFLNMCIQAPRSARVRSIRGSSKSIHSSLVAKQASSIHWQNIVKSLDHIMDTLHENHVPSMITRKIFSQVFSFINVQLFNSLLLRRECCSFSNGEYVKSGLQDLEQWCSKATDEFAGMSWDALQHIRQAVGFLVIGKMRTLMTEDSVTMPNNSFLLDDDSSIPFSLDDVSRFVIDTNLSEVEPSPLLRQNSEFHFLMQH